MIHSRRFVSSQNVRLNGTAFTLVEVLVVIVIVSLMAAMVLTATAGVNRSAREARTRSIVAAVDRVIQEKYEALRYRPLAVEIPSLFTDPTIARDDTEIGYEVLAEEAARIRLIMLRDLMRMELPDHFADITQAPATINAACSRVRVDTSTGQIRGTRDALNERRVFPVNWPSGVSGSRLAMQNRIAPAPSFSLLPSLENQSSECLYLIMTTTFIAGSPAIDAIPTSNIGDIDNDGYPEILDGWGRPLGFVRWPVGYQESQIIDSSVADDFDLFNSDFAYQFRTTMPAPTGAAAPLAIDVQSGLSAIFPWSLKPLVLSAGDDGEFGIALHPTDASGVALTGFNHLSTASGADWRWPINAANMGGQAQGRVNPSIASIHYPDPYLRRFIVANDVGILDRTSGWSSYTTKRRLPGEDLVPDDEYPNEMRDPRKADNITNYSLQAME